MSNLSRFLFVLIFMPVLACESGTEELRGGDAQSSAEDADAGRDVGIGHDLIANDFGVRDAGIEDEGIRDRGSDPIDIGPPPEDAGMRDCAQLELTPSDTVVFPINGPRRQFLILRNVGTCDVVVTGIRISGPQNAPLHPSADDFAIIGPTTFTVPVGQSFIDLPIEYANNDISTIDFAELHIESNDADLPEHVVTLTAEDNPCFFPTPVITVVTANPTAQQPVTLDATMSDPGGPINGPAQIASYEWEWLFAPNALPVFSAPNGAITTFTPDSSGTYVVGLRISNDCGSTSPTPATETINVP